MFVNYGRTTFESYSHFYSEFHDFSSLVARFFKSVVKYLLNTQTLLKANSELASAYRRNPSKLVGK